MSARCICSRAPSFPRKTRAARSDSLNACCVWPRYASVSERLIRASAARTPSRARSAISIARRRWTTEPSTSRTSFATRPNARSAVEAASASPSSVARRSARSAAPRARAGSPRPPRRPATRWGRRSPRSDRDPLRGHGRAGLVAAPAEADRPRLDVVGGEAPELVRLKLEQTAHVAELDRADCGRGELREDPAVVALGGHLELDRQLGRLKGQQPDSVRAANGEQALRVECRVVCELGQLGVDRAPREGAARRGQNTLRNGIAFRRERAKLLEEEVVVGVELVLRAVAHQLSSSPESWSASEIPTRAASPRSRSRQRARVGPMLPIGVSRDSLTSS